MVNQTVVHKRKEKEIFENLQRTTNLKREKSFIFPKERLHYIYRVSLAASILIEKF
jgi:hypothetical protein